MYCEETPCWLCHAINHENGDVIAYVLGSRKREMLEKLNDMLNSLNLNVTHVYSDNIFAYHSVITHKILKIGKNNTQKTERKHLTFRTRLKRLTRKTICYSKSLEMHKILIGLLINLLEFSPKLL